MSDQENNTQKKKRITWKQAFHLLKCVALRRFKLKYIEENHGEKAKVDNVKDKVKLKLEDTGEKIIYARRPEKKGVTIIDLNRNLFLNRFELNSDSLARSIVTGIIKEIKSRSSSSQSLSRSSSGIKDFDEDVKPAEPAMAKRVEFDVPKSEKKVIDVFKNFDDGKPASSKGSEFNETKKVAPRPIFKSQNRDSKKPNKQASSPIEMSITSKHDMSGRKLKQPILTNILPSSNNNQGKGAKKQFDKEVSSVKTDETPKVDVLSNVDTEFEANNDKLNTTLETVEEKVIKEAEILSIKSEAKSEVEILEDKKLLDSSNVADLINESDLKVVENVDQDLNKNATKVNVTSVLILENKVDSSIKTPLEVIHEEKTDFNDDSKINITLPSSALEIQLDVDGQTKDDFKTDDRGKIDIDFDTKTSETDRSESTVQNEILELPSSTHIDDLINKDLETGEIIDKPNLESLEKKDNIEEEPESTKLESEEKIIEQVNVEKETNEVLEVDENKTIDQDLNAEENNLKHASEVDLNSDLNGAAELEDLIENEIENVPQAESVVAKKNDSSPRLADNKPKKILSPILFSVRAENPDYSSSEEEDSEKVEELENLNAEEEKIKIITTEQKDDLNKINVKKTDFIESKVEIEDTKISDKLTLANETANIAASNEANYTKDSLSDKDKTEPVEEKKDSVPELPQNDDKSEKAADKTDSGDQSQSGGQETQRSEMTEKVEKVEKPNAEEMKPKPKKTKVAKPQMDPEFFYNYDELKFKPVISEESNLNPATLKLFHSFGYDCKKRANLNILDPETLIFSAGNLVQILNIRTKEQKYIETMSGGAVGAITVHPSRKYFAVGEKGNVPNVNIYEYPSLKLFRILRQGTIKGYAFLDFDPTGNLLASLGHSPDFMLTIWDWQQENVVLRTKAFSQDVFKVTFSKDLKGILTSGGTGHIKFWKMASTFTGYKLQGDLGKFGKTEISDVEGYAELPDGKVLSGSEWGNMLLWDGGLIQTEICRKKNKPCHVGPIQQITLNEGDIYTIGDDGSIRVWDFETIDTSEPAEEGVKLEIEPLNELKVGNNVALRSMVKDFTEESTIWFAQDSNGGIWKLDLSFSASSENPRQLFSYHSGVIHGIECCPNSHLFATTADDGSVRVYNYLNYEAIAQKKFNKGGSSIKWLSTEVDPDGATLAAGFNDGVLRFIKIQPKSNSTPEQPQFELVMFEAFKPHTKAVSKIAIDAKNTIIATGSDDQTIFFFSNSKNTRTPIGFVNLPSPVTYMTWTPAEYKQSRLLVCLKNGAIYEFEAPVPGKYDTSKSYLIELNLNYRKCNFKSIKSRLRHEEELERKRIEEEERKKKEAEERRLRGIDEDEEKKKKKKKEGEAEGEDKGGEAKEGDESKEAKKEGEAGEEEEQQKPKEDEWKPFIPEVPSKICWAYYSSVDTFWVSMDDYDAGYLYECKFFDEATRSKMSAEKLDEPVRAVPVFGSDITHAEDIPLTYMIQDKKKNFSIIGEKNGVIRVQPMPDSKLIEEMKHYWSTSFHDNEYGHITGLCLSYDEKFLFSVGADSNIFGILFNTSMEDLEKAKAEKIKLTCQVPVSAAADIDDPQAYSIEQAKLKSEHDKMVAIAESKKQDMRQKINQLRKTFKDLTVKNDQLVPRLKLSKNEFLLEESIKQQVLQQINDKITVTWKELAWNTEKCRISLEKLKSKFKDVIDCEHIVVFTFDGSLSVSTFRTVTLPKDMENYKNDLEKQYLAKLIEKEKTKENMENQGANDKKEAQEEVQLDGPSAADQIKKIFGKLQGNTAARVERALRKMDEKKLKRLRRKKEWEDLLSSRLPDNYENPEDLSHIKHAQDTLGDFKLKSDKNYVVPENQRMNVYKAVERLMQIKEFLNKNQMIFNNKLLTFRDKKKGLVGEINADIDRLEQIQVILGQPLTKVMERVSLRPEETPEKKYEYNKEKLQEFKAKIESKSYNANANKEEEHNAGGFGGFGGSNQAPNSANIKKQSTNSHASDHSQIDTKTLPHLEGVKQLWQKDHMSKLMQQTLKTQEVKLMFEQKQLIKRIEEKILLFDAELKVLRHEKARIAVFMKNADLRHVTIFEEFMLLRDFEKTENELENKLSKKREEHLEMQLKLTEIQVRIDNKKKDIEKFDDNQKQLLQTYQQMTHDETKYADFLFKVFKRKIKRKKKTEGAAEDEESEEESDEDDDEDEDLDDEDDDSENEAKEQLDLDICPSGLRQELYDQVCQLREKRLDLEELVAEEKKVLEQFKKDQDSLIKKAKLAENSLKQAQQELENFQKEKQKKINNLDIVVTMRLNQLQYLSKGRLPADLSESLAFDSKNLDRLQSRIKELQEEKSKEKELFKEFKRHHQELIRDKKKMDEYVGRLDELCNKMMNDKFGKLVDLERLELIAVNQQIEELKQKLAENEFEHEKVMQEWLYKINSGKDESIDLIKANTVRLNEMVEKLSETKHLEKAMDAKQGNLGEEMAGNTKKDLEERQRLHTLVQLQAQEVEALKAEIAILSRKGGHILPPTQPPNMTQMSTV